MILNKLPIGRASCSNYFKLYFSTSSPSAQYYIPTNNVSKPQKPLYTTTPIFYVNAAPHIGHLHSMVLTDILTRWNSLIKYDRPTFFTTGTDEHGLKVQQAAQSARKNPREFVDLASQSFKQLAEKANISHNRFIRTTDLDNVEAAKALWQILQSKGYIYKGQHSGWYCISDEAFYPETQVMKRQDDGAMISKESGKIVEWTSEENYFFALSKLREPLLEHLRANPDWIVPKQKWNDVEREVSIGLEDLSVSRPVSRNSWGVRVPNDETQVMYVWFDALINYLAAAGFPWTTLQDYQNSSWPPDIQVIGKDIVRFHAVYWPAFLLAAGIPLPKKLVVHSHWTLDGSKMSKSSGNVVDPIYTIEMFGADSLKFFLANDGYIDHDTVYSNSRILARHNSELVNKYGNLVMRVCGHKFNITRALKQDEKVFETMPSELGDLHIALKHDIDTLLDRTTSHMEEFQTARALGEIWNVISTANRYLQEGAPWTYKDSTEQPDAIIKDAAETARVSSILLQPFIPEISKKMLDRLSVHPQKRTIEYARYGVDNSYGENANRKGDYPVTVIEG